MFLLHRIQLSAPRTSGVSDGRFLHDGFVLKLCADDNIVGFGEVCLYTISIYIVVYAYCIYLLAYWLTLKHSLSYGHCDKPVQSGECSITAYMANIVFRVYWPTFVR